ncbi:transcription regulator HTH, apses-type DNA-binding domain-containing protein, partial [Chytridium lagenaria]
MSRLAVPTQGLVDPTSTASSSYSSSTSSSAGTAATTPIVPTAQVLVAQLDAASAAAAAATVAGNATSAGGALAIAPKPDVSKTTPIAASKAPLHKPAEPNETVGTVYGAIYSGVPVYEMICRNVAMMRRRSDSYLNATQILKAAGIEKGRRTKILDKEIAQGQHEKIQGGYGKYQGTWIPFDRGVYLSQQFEIYELIKPLLD